MTNIFFLKIFIQKPGIIFTKISHLLTWYLKRRFACYTLRALRLLFVSQSVRAREAKSKPWESHPGLRAIRKYRKIKKRKKVTNMIKVNKSSQVAKKCWGSTQKSCWSNSIISIDRVERTQSFCENWTRWSMNSTQSTASSSAGQAGLAGEGGTAGRAIQVAGPLPGSRAGKPGLAGGCRALELNMFKLNSTYFELELNMFKLNSTYFELELNMSVCISILNQYVWTWTCVILEKSCWSREKYERAREKHVIEHDFFEKTRAYWNFLSTRETFYHNSFINHI